MKDKALANFNAARLLTENSFYDSAASRSYYAAYLMAWHFLDIMGESPTGEAPDGSRFWYHLSFPKELLKRGCIGKVQRDAMKFLYQLRVRADYYPENIEENEARKSMKFAYGFIEHFAEKERRTE